MSQSAEVTVEVFRDSETKNAPVGVAEQAVDKLRQMATGIQIVRATRLIVVAPPDKHHINTSNIKWPEFQADLNVILSRRIIYAPDATDNPSVELPEDRAALRSHTNGVSIRKISNSGRLRVALVGVNFSLRPDVVAAHEMSHLLNVKSRGEQWDGKGHCTNVDCVMYPSEEFILPTDPQPNQPYRRLRGLFKQGDSSPKSPKPTVAEDFCDECALQVGQNSYFLQKAKSGDFVPDNLLP